jgi:uncharacterized protein with FMN-binding domain
VRRVLLTTTATGGLVVLLLALKPHHAASVSASTTPTTGSSTEPGASAGTSGSSAGSRSGTFTGDAVGTRYGPVQVSVTLAKGRVTAVHVLQVPDRGGYEQRIVTYAVPELTKEALAAQSAHIDTVSGATYTSEGYASSLQSALDKAAKAATPDGSSGG